jgi:hypothetical protein
MVVLQGIFKDGIQHVKLMSFNITMGNDRIQTMICREPYSNE